MTERKRQPFPWKAYGAAIAGASVLAYAGGPAWMGAAFGFCVALIYYGFFPVKP